MPNPKLQKKPKNGRYQQSWKDQRGGKQTRQNIPRQKKRSKGPQKGIIKRIVFNKYTLTFLAIVVLLVAVLGVTTVAWMSRNLPNPDQLMNREVSQTTKIYDRSGDTLLYKIHGKQQRTLMSLEDIPDHVQHAAIAIEDKSFYQHEGFSLWAIFRTAVTNIIYNEKAGASTLTQQLVKNTVLTPEKTYVRKIKELILAYKMENIYSKDQILQMYLNEIPYGGMAYGVEAASQHYFGKSVTEINIAEAATLAALPQAPSHYSPYGPNKEELIGRQKYIINLIQQQGYITKKEARRAKEYKVKFREPDTNIKAPHFVMYVKRMLADKYGQRALEQQGLKVYTTLDWYKQKKAKKIVKKWAEKNKKIYNANNASLVSINPKTGQILAMVGSKNYFSDEFDGQFNVATADRQPGSSLKPMIYATAFEKGYKPATILYDTKTDFAPGKGKYQPQNFDGEFRGPISMKKALAGSLNIPAVKTLYLAKKEKAIENLKDLGYTTLDKPDRYGLSLVLGGGEVKLLEHTNAYAAFAREGTIHPHSAILKVKNSEGEVIEEFEEKNREVWEKQDARMINDVLSDNSARVFAYGEDNELTLKNRPVAAKTGTTNNFKDAWTLGYTPSLVTGVWVGNNNNSSMAQGAYGGTVAAPIWNEYMTTILRDTPVEQFKEPQTKKTGKDIIDGDMDFTETVKIDKASGLLATEYTPKNYVEEITFEKHHNILHYVDKENPLEEKPENPKEDPQYKNWEKGVREWIKEEFKDATSTKPMSEKPKKEDNLHRPEYRPTFQVSGIENKQIWSEPQLKASITDASAPRGIARTEFYANGELIHSTGNYPFEMRKDITFLKNGFHDLTVKVCDDIDNCRSKKTTFNLKLSEEQRPEEKMDISWVYPTSGLAVNSIDFPINLKFSLGDPQGIDSLGIYVSPKNSTTTTLYSSSDTPPSLVSQKWEEPSGGGSYTLWGEIQGRGRTMTSKKITITINTSTSN